ncbi:hypothetical protein KFE25_009368 [Diacronema lutheri]|uniref:Carbohydrate kinase PfkB domain-containing protein n=1 Tax=Diacronema lutheri TaxID=2081491 RepID=A0A8J6CDF5_DIALT|nr:hypothetical protein KFE25_009368 [Diacronema lutheri]
MQRLRALDRQVRPALLQLPQAPSDEPGEHMIVSAHVRDALRDGAAVVALESTIISHGMPWPQNLETARAVEAEVRAQGAVPATIAVLDGRCIIGLDDSQLERLARLGRERVRKVSRRDLAAVVASGGHGATTVSATMLLAHAAGIRVFVTGGVGGVHRGGQDSLDISADLVELARTPVAVVCAGVKSILDIGRTLEVLETAGVTVATVGEAEAEFPAFFTAASGHASPLVWPSEAAAAAAVHAALALRLRSGQLIAVPVPAEHAAEGAQIEASIQRALGEADARGVRGPDATPFLLQRVAELTAGASLRSNVALIRNNARVGARIAVELARRLRTAAPELAPVVTAAAAAPAPVGPLVVGGTAADLTARPDAAGAGLLLRTSSPGALELSAGGVARNVCEALARLGCRPRLVSLVGADALGDLVLRASTDAGIDVTAVCAAPRGARTATYTALHAADGDLLAAIADMQICAQMDGAWVRASVAPLLAHAPIVVADANLAPDGLRALADACAAERVPLFVEPVSVPKAAAAARTGALAACAFVSPNEDELIAIARALGACVPAALSAEGSAAREREVEAAASAVLAHGTHTLLVTRGAAGVLLASRDGAQPGGTVRHARYAAHAAHVHSTRGAGDSFVGGFVGAWLRGADEAACVHAALAAAAASLECDAAISPALSPELLTTWVAHRSSAADVWHPE